MDELSRSREEQRRTQEELKNLKEELEIQTWGLTKTNESIKLLYKELEEKNIRLQELDRLKSEFISIVSHELRTPLAIIKEGISLVLDRITGDINGKQERVLAQARDNVDRLARIINNLLDISKIEAGKIELQRDLVDITRLIRQVVSSFEAAGKGKGLELKTAFSGNRIDVYVDADKIIQVFTNLIGNAMKFTEKGYIEVSAQDKKSEIECCVADTGRGISKEDLPRTFNKFEQFGRTDGPGERGTGLGLSISKGIIETHKGAIWVESVLGKGTRFTFTLPKYSSEELFKEYIGNGIREAMKRESKMSIIVLSIAGFSRLKGVLSEERLQAVLKEMRDVANGSLRRAGDIVVKDTGEIIILLAGCAREGVVGTEKRLEKALNEYLAGRGLTEKIRFRLGCATYPDEGKTDKELIRRAKQS